jgi:hypothetical protein
MRSALAGEFNFFYGKELERLVFSPPQAFNPAPARAKDNFLKPGMLLA